MAEYKYRGARAAVMLHETEMRQFLEAWKKAKAAGLELPPDEDPDFATLDALLNHVFRWSGKYLTWTCEQLELPDPKILPVPEPVEMDSRAEAYTDHVLQAWESPLRDVPTGRFFKKTYAAPWGIQYCIDAMLEHAVMHPAKHRFQLEELMGER